VVLVVVVLVLVGTVVVEVVVVVGGGGPPQNLNAHSALTAWQLPIPLSAGELSWHAWLHSRWPRVPWPFESTHSWQPLMQPAMRARNGALHVWNRPKQKHP
jgi:hypothetical protein